MQILGSSNARLTICTVSEIEHDTAHRPRACVGQIDRRDGHRVIGSQAKTDMASPLHCERCGAVNGQHRR